MRVIFLKCLDATIGLILCWTVGVIRYLARQDRPASGGPMDKAVRRVLVVRPGGMGDMVLLLPVLKALRLRYPGLILHLVCEKRNRDILKLAGLSDQAILYDANPLALLWSLPRGQYDVAIDTEQFHYFSALMTLLSRAPVRIGFKINPGRNLLYTHLVNYDLEGYEADQFMRLLGPLGITEAVPVDGCLEVAADSIPTESLGQIERLEVARRLVVVHAGSTNRYKLWAPEKVAELILALGKDPTLSFVLLGNGGERSLADQIVGRVGMDGRVLSLVGRLTVAQSAAVIHRAALFVGGDSGLAHVAVALGAPTVVWFGPSDSQKWGVRGPRNKVVRKPLACAPCFIFGYHKLCRTVACMREIAVGDVLNACWSILVPVAPAPPRS